MRSNRNGDLNYIHIMIPSENIKVINENGEQIEDPISEDYNSTQHEEKYLYEIGAYIKELNRVSISSY